MRIVQLCLLLSLISCISAVAQPLPKGYDDNEDDPYETARYFMYGANYQSDNVYLGRKDTLTAPYFSPYFGYHFICGLYAKTTLSYSANKRRIDLLTLEAGYEHTFGEHFNTGANLDKYFYNKNTNNLRGNIRENAGMYGQYGNDWIEPMICFDANFNKKTDYIIGLTLDHKFKLLDKTLIIIPMVTLNSGTQHFFDDYLLARLLKTDKTLKLTKTLANAGRFKALDYELSTKVTYRVNKWLFTAIPTYAIPLNPNTIVFPTRSYQEKISNSFYLELDICHR